MMDFKSSALMFFVILNLGFGAFVAIKNRKSLINRSYAAFLLCLALWSFALAMFYIVSTDASSVFWANSIYFSGSLIAVAFFYFSFVFPSGKNPSWKKTFLPLGSLSLLFVLYFFTSGMVNGVEYRNGVKTFIYGDYHFIFDIHFSLLFGLAFWKLYRDVKTLLGQKKEQAKYLLLSTGIGVVFNGATNVIMPSLLHDCSLVWSGPYITFVMVCIMTYAIVKYRLMDITIFAARTFILAIVYFLVLGIPFWIGYQYGRWRLATWLSVFLASAGPFIYTYLRRQAEEVLLREQRRYQQALRKLAESMLHIRQLDELLKTVTSVIVDTVKIDFAGIYLKNQQYGAYHLRSCCPQWQKSSFNEYLPLDYLLVKSLISQKKPILGEEVGMRDKPQKDSSLVVPFFVEEGGLIGFMVLGSKANNQMYTPDDVFSFETLSYSTSLAIENCIYWKEIEDRQRKARLQEMDAYSYSLAHEIDNPMQVIMGQAELLQKEFIKNISTKRRKELTDSFGFITEAARRVSGMVRAIRDFGSQVTGELKPIKAEDVVEGFSRLYFPQFKANSVLFNKEIASDLGYLRGEKPELMQVLVILANNAVHAMKYSKEKMVTLKVEHTIHDSVKISLSDTGCGIKKELLPIIFAPFTTTKASTEGTGMGLYNAKRIIEKHRGMIEVASEGESTGTTFIIELPVAKDVSKKELEKDEVKSKRLI